MNARIHYDFLAARPFLRTGLLLNRRLRRLRRLLTTSDRTWYGYF